MFNLIILGLSQDVLFFNDIINIVNDIYSNNLKAVTGARRFLEKANLNYFIGSNSVKERILVGLKKVKFENFFTPDKVYSFDMVEKAKPEPDIYLSAMYSNNLNAEETIIIEDSAIGVLAGVKAGVKVVGLTAGGHWYPDRSKSELKEAGAHLLIDDYEVLNMCVASYSPTNYYYKLKHFLEKESKVIKKEHLLEDRGQGLLTNYKK